MRTFGFGKGAHGVDGQHLYVYRGQEEKENEVWARGKDRGRYLEWGAPDK